MKCPGAELAEMLYAEDGYIIESKENLEIFCFVKYSNDNQSFLIGEKNPILNHKQQCNHVGLNFINANQFTLLQLLQLIEYAISHGYLHHIPKSLLLQQ